MLHADPVILCALGLLLIALGAALLNAHLRAEADRACGDAAARTEPARREALAAVRADHETRLRLLRGSVLPQDEIDRLAAVERDLLAARERLLVAD